MAVCVPGLALGQTDSVQAEVPEPPLAVEPDSIDVPATPAVAPTASSSARASETVVEAREVVSRRAESPGAVRVIGRDELSRSFALSDILGREPGTLVRSYGGGLGNYATLSMRGSPSEQVEVRIDGVPVGGSAGSSVDVGPFALDGLERVELRQGTSAGSDGAPRLDLVSRRGWTRAGFSARSGSFGERGVSGWAGTPNGFATVSGWWETARNDYSFPWNNGTEYNKSDDVARKLSNNDFTGWGAAVAVRPSERWDASARLESSERGLTTLYLADPHGRWTRTAGQGRLAWRDEGELDRRFEASWRQGYADWRDPGQSTGYTADLESEETTQDARIEGSLARQGERWWDPRVSAFARWEASDRRSLGRQQTSVTPRGDRLSLGGGLGWSGRSSDRFGAELDVKSAWLRDERNFQTSLGGTVVPSTTTDKGMFASRGVARLWATLFAGTRSWVSGSLQERAPDFSEWMGSSGGVVPALELEPEFSRTAEWGIEWSSPGLQVSTSLWLSRFDDPIQARAQGGSPFVSYRNGAGMGANGWDAKLFWCADRAALSLSGTLQDAFLRDANPALDGNRPQRTPAAKGSMELQAGPWLGFSVGYVMEAQSQVWASDLNTADDRRDPWVMHSVWAKFRRGPVGFSVMAKNLGDVRLPDLEDMPLQGRQFLARLDLDLSTNTHPTNGRTLE